MTAPGPPLGCPRCGTPYEPGQEYCLDCGLRLPARQAFLGGVARLWAERGWSPGDWVWPVLAFFLIGALGALVAIIVSNGRRGQTTTIVAIPPAALQTTVVATAPRVTTTTVQPSSVPATTTRPAATAPEPPSTTASPGLATWTAADGYTIVLSSVPWASGRAVLERAARKALRNGLRQVGIVNSADYSSLHPGYFVLFAGQYASQADAADDVGEAKAAGFASAYARRITR